MNPPSFYKNSCDITLLETNIEPQNGWLEYDCFLLGPDLFAGAFAVSFKEGNLYSYGSMDCLLYGCFQK